MAADARSDVLACVRRAACLGPHAPVGMRCALAGALLGAAVTPRAAAHAQSGSRPPEPDTLIPAPSRSGDPWADRLERAGLGWAARALRDTVRTPRAGDRPDAGADTLRGLKGDPRPVAPCQGQRVSDVVVVTQPPYAGGLLGRLGFVASAARSVHSTTRPEVIRRFLLLSPGDPCVELRRAESERILRAQPYLVDARVLPYDDGQGGVVLEVHTRDEFSTIVAFAARTAAPPVSALKLGEANFMGRAMYVAGEWRDNGQGFQDGVGARVTHYQFLGRPYQLMAEGRRRWIGDEWRADVSYPFLTDLQRIAWRVGGGGSNEFLRMRRPGPDQNALFFRRGYADVGGVVRVGRPGRLNLFGVSATMERALTSDDVRQVTDTGLFADAGIPLQFRPGERYPEQRVVRLNALYGVRKVRFLPVTGFDALTGTQDVPRGVQVGALVGRGLRVLGSDDNDLFLSTEFQGGYGTSRSFVRFQLEGEGRKASRATEWSGLVAGGRAVWYQVPNERWRTVASVEYGASWRPRVPMQLALGDREGGIIGFRDAQAAGARRLVARLEERWFLGRPFGLGDAGLAGFVDAGKLWAGAAPYGVSTGPRASVGVGILAAVPPQSRRLWRVDVAFPVTREPGAKWELRFSNRDLTRFFWREPYDVRIGREQSGPVNVFNWPQAY